MRECTTYIVHAAINLGGRVTVMLLKASTDNSMFIKHYEGIVPNFLSGCEPIFLWSKLVCLMLLSTKIKVPQFLCAVSYQQAVRDSSRFRGLGGLILCLPKIRTSGKVSMRDFTKRTGDLRELMHRTLGTGLRRTKRTLGSPILFGGRPFLGCYAGPIPNCLGDGALVVRIPSTDLSIGRGGRRVRQKEEEPWAHAQSQFDLFR